MSAQKSVMSVLGPLAPEDLGMTDAHNHLWIEPVEGAAAGSPVLTEREALLTELGEYRAAGGGALLDCQPGDCGRHAGRLAELSALSGVAVVCCTGYHRQRYYPPGHAFWTMDAEACAARFLSELGQGCAETLDGPRVVRPGYVKAALEASLAATPAASLEGAIQAALEGGTALLAHTEKGQDVEAFVDFCQLRGLEARRLILCHVDKRADFGFHREMAQTGALLEYDTFYRPQYRPEENAWPLVERMVAAGFEGSVALATDMAERALWRFGGGPGLTGFAGMFRARLAQMGVSTEAASRMCGRNVAERLAI